MRLGLSFVLVASMATVVRAEDVLPTLTIQADTAGKGAKLKAGFDLRFGEPSSMIISPFIQATTDEGVSKLFTLDSDGISASGSWEVGGVLTRLYWPGTWSPEAAGYSAEYRLLESSQYNFCRSFCEPRALGPAATFCAARTRLHGQLEGSAIQNPGLDPVLTRRLRDRDAAEAAAAAAEQNAASIPNVMERLDDRRRATSVAAGLRQQARDQREAAIALLDDKARLLMDYHEYCPQAQEVLGRYLQEHYDAWTTVPTSAISVGVSAGMTVDEYLDPGGDGSLSLQDETHTTQSLAAVYLRHMSRFTIEVPVLLKRRFKIATSESAKWCVPAGQVLEEGGAVVDAESCDQQPVGPLHRRYSVQAGALVGWFTPSSYWRLSIGPTASISSRARGEAAAAYKVGFVAPLYIGTSLLKKDLKTLLRLSVGMFHARASDGRHDRSFSVTLTVLGGSTLFASPFDQF